MWVRPSPVTSLELMLPPGGACVRGLGVGAGLGRLGRGLIEGAVERAHQRRGDHARQDTEDGVDDETRG
jgi:hypothetical protein